MQGMIVPVESPHIPLVETQMLAGLAATRLRFDLATRGDILYVDAWLRLLRAVPWVGLCMLVAGARLSATGRSTPVQLEIESVWSSSCIQILTSDARC